MIQVTPLKTTEQYEVLVNKAKQDNHRVIWPSHLIKQNSEIVGYLSILTTPVVNVWYDSKAVKVRHTLEINNIAETLAMEKGANQIIVPCTIHSPLHVYMEKFGFTTIGDTTLFIKNLI